MDRLVLTFHPQPMLGFLQLIRVRTHFLLESSVFIGETVDLGGVPGRIKVHLLEQKSQEIYSSSKHLYSILRYARPGLVLVYFLEDQLLK